MRLRYLQPCVMRRVFQDIHERFLRAIVSQENDAQTPYAQILSYVIPGFARHDGIRAGGERPFPKITKGAAQYGDAMAILGGSTPNTRSGIEGASGNISDIVKRSASCKVGDGAQTGASGVEIELKGALGLHAQEIAQERSSLKGPIEIRMQRDDAHAESSRREDCRTGTRLGTILRTKNIRSLDIDGMMGKQDVGAQTVRMTNICLGCIQSTGHGSYHRTRISNRKPNVVPAFSILQWKTSKQI